MSKSSLVWDYFTIEKDNIMVKCGLCRIKLKNNKASTSNLIRHMRSKHPTINLLNRNVRTIEEQVDDPDETASTSNVVCINLFFKYNTYNFSIIHSN